MIYHLYDRFPRINVPSSQPSGVHDTTGRPLRCHCSDTTGQQSNNTAERGGQSASVGDLVDRELEIFTQPFLYTKYIFGSNK
jgi:hypothetical protein